VLDTKFADPAKLAVYVLSSSLSNAGMVPPQVATPFVRVTVEQPAEGKRGLRLIAGRSRDGDGHSKGDDRDHGQTHGATEMHVATMGRARTGDIRETPRTIPHPPADRLSANNSG
jgi:hypothetical protein